jgi:D-apionolactonase
VLWLANLTGEKQSVKVSGFKGGAHVHVLDEKTFDALVKRPDYLSRPGTKVRKVSSLELGPYAVVRASAA